MPTIGLIGTGIFASTKHLPAINKTPGLEVVGCFNRTRSKAEDFAAKAGADVKVYDSVEALVQDPAVESVDALLPVEQNLGVVKLAVAARKPVCIEKPIAAELADARAIVELAESTDVPVMVLENWCFHHGTQKLRELLPQIGDVIMFNYQASGPFRLTAYHGTAWRQKPQHAGGFISDAGVHDLALVTEVLGPIGSVSARATQAQPESGTVDTITALLNMSRHGVFGSYTSARYSGAAESVLKFQIFGKNGSLVYEKPSPTQNRVVMRLGRGSEDLTEQTFELPEDDLNGVTAEFANWADVLASGDKSRILVTPRKAFAHYAPIVAAIKSSQNEGAFVHVQKVDDKDE